MTCTIAECGRPAEARGWCRMHYKRWTRTGDPLVVRKIARSTSPTCSILGCDRTVHAKGLCSVHAGRERYHGDPLAGGPERLIGAPLAERFWSHVERRGAEECWPWTSGITPNGYGVFCWDAHRFAAHRVALELDQGFAPPPELDVDHVCHSLDVTCFDVPCAHRRCCNPAHLEAVTHAENVRRGRRNFARTGPG